ncbi:hypothetical protein EJ08DRAFT_664249 [Tothia fuscella]|uniref:Uncharacterized protein n=1 Tax=Tothia fuscella TaxID=1048955 RepID=A0A9P4NJV8_9PEZI|nr:hypothetical protein EJ08DRAFT_664249 [Tothia fuscella]
MKKKRTLPRMTTILRTRKVQFNFASARKTPFKYLELPVELRIKIMSIYLVDHDEYEASLYLPKYRNAKHTFVGPNNTALPSLRAYGYYAIPALAQVNKQLRHEVLEEHLGKVYHFVPPIRGLQQQVMEDWSGMLGKDGVKYARKWRFERAGYERGLPVDIVESAGLIDEMVGKKERGVLTVGDVVKTVEEIRGKLWY